MAEHFICDCVAVNQQTHFEQNRLEQADVRAIARKNILGFFSSNWDKKIKRNNIIDRIGRSEQRLNIQSTDAQSANLPLRLNRIHFEKSM